MRVARWSLGLAMILTMLFTMGAVAQEEPEQAEDASEAASSTFQETVEFGPLKSTDLGGMAGQIEVKKVDFAVANAKGGGIKGAFSSDDAEMHVVITTNFTCVTSAETKQKFDMKVEFLDKDGQVIDRAMSSANFKKNEKKFEIKHTTLKWALDHIAKARVTVEAVE
jgi:hypothetical protein